MENIKKELKQVFKEKNIIANIFILISIIWLSPVFIIYILILSCIVRPIRMIMNNIKNED
jgi:hypothetical protein